MRKLIDRFLINAARRFGLLHPQKDKDLILDHAESLGMLRADQLHDWAESNGFLGGSDLSEWAAANDYIHLSEVEVVGLESAKAHLEATKRQDPGKWEYQYLPMLKELIGEQA